MYTEFGTTYNSYVMKAGDRPVLFETAKAKFFDDYLEKLQEVTDVHKIDYLVVSHTEPDHAGQRGAAAGLQPSDEDHCHGLRHRIPEGDRETGTL